MTRTFWILSLGLLGCTPNPTPQPLTSPTSPTDEIISPTGASDPAGTTPPGAPTWHQDVAPLLARRCGGCHYEGGIGPFSIATYEEALPWSIPIQDSVLSGRMPPFPVETDSEACSMELGFLDDPRLADEDKQLISDWVEAGSPEGDPATAVDAPMHAPRELEDYDVELPIQEDFLVDGDRDIYRCFRIPLSLQQDVWLTGMQILPGNDAVVHHVLVWTDPDDSSAGQAGADGSYGCSGFPDIFPTELAGAWAPGGQPPEFPQGTGMPLSAGSSLVMNIHYHPTGTSTERDRTRIRLRWDEQPPEHEAKFSLLDLPFGSMLQEGPADEGWLPEFKIPAGATAHTETSEAFLPPLLNGDMQIFTVGPHMHYLGTEMLVTLDRGNQGEQCLLHTPDFRFDWQSAFAYDPSTGDLPLWRAGDNVRVQCTYNNSGTNPYLPLHLEARGVDAPQDVGWGEETGDEMCMAIVGLILP